MSKHLIVVTAAYKMGHQRFKCKLQIVGRNILRIEEIPPDIPENQELGVNTRIQTSIGEYISVVEEYETVVAEWAETLESL